jgi:hypothetical protein
MDLGRKQRQSKVHSSGNIFPHKSLNSTPPQHEQVMVTFDVSSNQSFDNKTTRRKKAWLPSLEQNPGIQRERVIGGLV